MIKPLWLWKLNINPWLWLANRVPRKLVYWCFFRVVAHATTGKYETQNVPELTVMDAIDRWGHD